MQDQGRRKPPIERVLKSPLLFAALTTFLSALYYWPRRWVLSGAPLLQFFVLLGDSNGYRVLPSIALWPIFSTFNLGYSICSTSWLLYGIFTAVCYPTIVLICLFQFEVVGNIARRALRALLKQLHFIDDKIAFFNIPALEIDTDVDGLLVLRGVTFSLSNLSFVVHGVEVGIKLSDDMELAIQSDEVTVRLFRGIDIGDCYANLKGGEFEMTFGGLEGNSKDSHGDAVFVEGTPLLNAASKDGDRRSIDGLSEKDVPLKEVKMAEVMTDGKVPAAVSPETGLKSMKRLSPDNEAASGRYFQMLNFIKDTSAIHEAREHVRSLTEQTVDVERTFDLSDDNAIRAAVCSQVHSKPSVPHPPQKSIRVSTIKSSSPPYVKRFLHRLPMLLRLLLNPLSYFHPVKVTAITTTASGRWIDSILVQKIFKEYAEQNSEIRHLQQSISSWLSDANFAVELGGITGIAHVPFISTYDINCHLMFNDVMAYRALPTQVELKQVVRLGGADARFVVPSFLLPHHEHLLPPPPSQNRRKNHELEQSVESADGKPQEINAQHSLTQSLSDETNVSISVHARLPACFDQELLDFTAALVKATKVVEMEKESSVMNDEVAGIKDFGKALKGGLKEGMKRAVVDGVVNERWIAKMVGKITRKLETARGEAGYSGDIPVKLEKYRTGLMESEGEKLLP
ncbi:hypothetical protein ONS95_000324 [Cadophora gregata]|uniref:uncharacterized protein n=1 Tax=Cadophora gregata TaxID=51156 RepID=UPI0026DC57EC|nr:uncharacterized protein ONS95_000324 [Cadophora gregata]KAK0125673.1 hypothetical protein ONS96_009506 [Cadophora gregata f. sp. sojae]KAK0128352.1 hypothetical protein ONS95_000324 [Cadophora gregata]